LIRGKTADRAALVLKGHELIRAEKLAGEVWALQAAKKLASTGFCFERARLQSCHQRFKIGIGFSR
jgi:hypothetical protein